MTPVEMLSQFPGGPYEVRIWNLTPHAVTLMLGDGNATPYREYPPEGFTLRATMEEEFAEDSMFPWNDCFRVRYHGIMGIEEQARRCRWRLGDILIVSTLAADAWEADGWSGLPVGAQVYVPDSGPTAVRNKDGQVLGVTRMIARRSLTIAEFQDMTHPESAPH